jgi:heme exporter protein D
MDALREFLGMGGYALYVWGAYGLSAAVLIVNALAPCLRERNLLRAIAARAEGKRE